MDTPLGKCVKAFEGGGDCLKYAENAFKRCVREYYEDLRLYNEDNGK